MGLGMFLGDFIVLLPEIFIFLSLVFFLLLGLLSESGNNKSFNSLHSLVYISIIVLILFLYLLYNIPVMDYFLFNFQLESSSLLVFAKAIIVVFSIGLLLIINNYYFYEDFKGYEIIVLFLLSILGMFLFLLSNDMLSLYLTLELQSFCFYVLTVGKRSSLYSGEAGLKYFILGSLASGFLLLGFSLIYGATGMTNFLDIKYLFLSNGIESNMCLIGLFLVFISFLFKFGAAPFHMWLIDVYDGAPTVVTAIFSILPKFALFIVFSKLFYYFFDFGIYNWYYVLYLVSFLSLFIGSLGGLTQVRGKRLLSYSTIGHTGFILFGFLAGSFLGIESVLIYLIIYMSISLGFFSILLSLRQYSDNKLLKNLGNFVYLKNSNIFLAYIFILLLFSIGGIPPLAGFFSKFLVFFSLILGGEYVLAFFGIIFSVLSMFYYLRLIKVLGFYEGNSYLFLYPLKYKVGFVLGLTSLFTIFILFYFSIITMFINNAWIYYF